MPRRPTSLVIALLAVLSAAPTASADTQYGGSGLYKGKAVASPSITLTVRDGRVIYDAATASPQR